MALIAVAPPYIPRRASPLPAVLRRTSPTQAVAAAAGVLVVGILLSIVTTPDPDWWQLHFSRLGTFRSFSGYSFNATIVAASVMLVLFAARLRLEMQRHAGTAVLTSRRAAHVVPALVALIGIHLSLVGFAPLNVNLFIHERGSSGAVLAFASLLASSRWMLRGMHRRVAIATRRVGASLVFWGVLFGFGVINLAAFEFVVFSLMFAWLVAVTRQLGVPSEKASRSVKPRTEDEAPCPTGSGLRWTDVHVVSAARGPMEIQHPRMQPSGRTAALPDRRRRAHQHAAAPRRPRGVSGSGAPRKSARSIRSGPDGTRLPGSCAPILCCIDSVVATLIPATARTHSRRIAASPGNSRVRRRGAGMTGPSSSSRQHLIRVHREIHTPPRLHLSPDKTTGG
ncbi:DUF998 domain-containing protein [Micromonospora sp. DT81.3]|uniref:DUF998 domain-containing protein n=1 Tax=Micromonospora sp. DT81.3 TaxID=3416523 RepID=UPI003CE6EE26